MPPDEGVWVNLLRQLASVRPGRPCPIRWPATGEGPAARQGPDITNLAAQSSAAVKRKEKHDK
jgi:hypothetical protein